jgi:hypothetical protein
LTKEQNKNTLSSNTGGKPMTDLVEDILALTALFAMGYAILLWGTIGAALAG